jgi:hypothetical protein
MSGGAARAGQCFGRAAWLYFVGIDVYVIVKRELVQPSMKRALVAAFVLPAGTVLRFASRNDAMRRQ